ncbi:hypothetical protein ACJRO7_032810 [Eucalyptus globulus]|uniref:NADP-dependent oxidoreductase domain-containing protein n=1 Tax=Eucalyptus globulus TaxID=34317 RepID=A0ABD3JJ62_EUCGL
MDRNKILYARIEKLAKQHDCSPVQLALAWMTCNWVSVLILGAFRRNNQDKNLDNNIGSLGVKLTEADVKEISDAIPIDEIVGDKIVDHFARLSWKYANTPPNRWEILSILGFSFASCN